MRVVISDGSESCVKCKIITIPDSFTIPKAVILQKKILQSTNFILNSLSNKYFENCKLIHCVIKICIKFKIQTNKDA